MSSAADQEKHIVLGSYSPEKVAAMRQAAIELGGSVAIRTYDPSIPEERQAYAELNSLIEADSQNYEKGSEGSRPRVPRSPAEIEREVIDHAASRGYELVAIEQPDSDFGEFWRQVDQVVAAGEPEQV
jgi:hypothetical protein